MSRHLIRSYLLALALSPFVDAGPCRPHPTSGMSRSESLTQTVSSSLVSSSVSLIHTESVSHSDTISQDDATGTGASINPTDTSLTFSNTNSISTASTEDIDVSTDWYPYLPISTSTYGDGSSSTAASISSAVDTSSTSGSESSISHSTDTATLSVSETAPSSAISTDTTATSSDTAVETQPTLSAATDTMSTGSETRSISADTTATSGEADASSTIGTETTTSVAVDTTVGTSGTDSSLAPSSDTTAASGEASSATTSATSTDTTETPKAAETTTTTSSDHSTTGTDSSTSTTETFSTDTTMTSSETTATSSQTDTIAVTQTGTSIITTDITLTETTAISMEMDTTTTAYGDNTTGTDSLTSTTETASTETTATSSQTTATTSGDSTASTEASSTTEATGSETTMTTKATDTTTTTSSDLTTTTATDSFTSTTQATSTDTTIISSETDTSTTTTSADSVTSTTETASTDTTVTTTGTETSGTTTSGEPSSTVTNTLTSTTETASTDSTTTETSMSVSETTTASSSGFTTTETTAFSSTTEATSTTSDTSSAAVPVCTPGFPISPPPQGLECDKKGQTSGHENIISWWDAGELTKSIDKCYNACKNTLGCGSIVFWKDTACELWRGKPGKTDGAGTDHGWYDIKCFCGEDTTEPAPTCTNSLKSPAPANKICGKTGYTGGTYTGQGSTNSLEVCAKSCESNNQCTSFTFESNSACFLYSGALEERSGLPTTWMSYELDCFCDLDEPDPEPEPGTGCKLRSPLPQNKFCGVTGYATGTNIDFVRDGPNESREACAQACKSEAQCTHFHFEVNSRCSLLSGTMTATDGQDLGAQWYDRDCWSCPSDEPEPNPPTEPEPTCKNNIINPIPDYRVCGATGWAGGLYLEGPGPEGSTKSLLACAKACTNGRCRAFKFEADQECTFYVGTGLTQPDGTATSYKWYQPECFCDLDKVEPEPEPTCKNNIVNPIPEELVCGEKGNGNGVYDKGSGPDGSSKSLRACADACITSDDCTFFQFEADQQCEFYVGRLNNLDNTQTSYKWYDKNCFCDLDKPAPTDPETNPPEPQPQCVNNALQPSPKDSACGAMGNPTTRGREEIGSSTETSVQGCRDACHKQVGCDSFQLEEGFNCYLFKGKVGSTDGRTTAEVWYDMSCFCDDTKTDPKDPEPVCVNNMLSPQPKNSNCGATGSILTDGISLDVLDWGDDTSLKACSDSCKAFEGCKSFTFLEQNFCMFFEASVGPTDGSATEHAYYDMSCFCDSNYATGG